MTAYPKIFILVFNMLKYIFLIYFNDIGGLGEEMELERKFLIIIKINIVLKKIKKIEFNRFDGF